MLVTQSDDELLDAITAIRQKRNGGWAYAMVQLALRVAPGVANPIFAAIRYHDAEIGRLDHELVGGANLNKRTPDEILTDIEAHRAINNTLHVTLFRIAMRNAPDETRQIIRQMIGEDQQITALGKELAEA